LSCRNESARAHLKRFDKAGDFGTIETGKRADLVLVAGNPLEDITNTQNILGVMARGRWYPQNALAEMIVMDD
jgi:imidazolonepropionase-like amidohydrolase